MHVRPVSSSSISLHFPHFRCEVITTLDDIHTVYKTTEFTENNNL